MKEEILKELMNNKEIKSTLTISAEINAIYLILKRNNLTTEEEFNKLVEQSEKDLLECSLKFMKEKLKADKSFKEMFEDTNNSFEKLFGENL